MACPRSTLEKEADSERSRLFNALLRFANSGARSSRKCYSLPAGKDILLRALLVEIDETVLPRRITLAADSGEKAILKVSNRRLTSLEIHHETPEATIQPQSDPTALAATYIEKVLGLMKRSSEISLEVTIHRQRSQANGLSCSAGSLANAAGLTDFVDSNDPSLDGFVESTKDLACAWKRQFSSCSDMKESHGSDESLKLLEEIFHAATDGSVACAQGQKFGSHRPACILLPLNHDRLATILTYQDTVFLALTTSAERQVILENWRFIRPGSSMGRV